MGDGSFVLDCSHGSLALSQFLFVGESLFEGFPEAEPVALVLALGMPR